MHTHLTEVLSRLDTARGALRRAIDAIPPAMHRQRPAADRWSAAEVLEHLTLVERIFGGRIVNALGAARSGLSPEAQPRAPLPDAVEQRMGDRVNRRQAPEPAQPTGTKILSHPNRSVERAALPVQLSRVKADRVIDRAAGFT